MRRDFDTSLGGVPRVELLAGGVAVLAGSTFGESGKGYLRLSYANSIEQIEEGVKRMKGVLEKTAARA